MSGRRVIVDGDNDGSAARPLTLSERFASLPSPPRVSVKTAFNVKLRDTGRAQARGDAVARTAQGRQTVLARRRQQPEPESPPARTPRGGGPTVRGRSGRGARGAVVSSRGRGGATRGGAAAAAAVSTRGARGGRGGSLKGSNKRGGAAAAAASSSNGAPRGGAKAARGTKKTRGTRGAAATAGNGTTRGGGRGGKGKKGDGNNGDTSRDTLDDELDRMMGRDPLKEKLNREMDDFNKARSAPSSAAASDAPAAAAPSAAASE